MTNNALKDEIVETYIENLIEEHVAPERTHHITTAKQLQDVGRQLSQTYNQMAQLKVTAETFREALEKLWECDPSFVTKILFKKHNVDLNKHDFIANVLKEGLKNK